MFQQAIQECISSASTKHKTELDSLLTLNFQTFKEVPLIENKPQGSISHTTKLQ
jgi:hypothetical protein